ncbi:MAG: pilus assembly protein N-terminal domain-containing protein [Gemmataceae bacterium]
MHRTNRVPSMAYAGFALALLLGGLSGFGVRAQDPAPPAPRNNALIVPINTSQRLQMATKKPISRVENSNENVARVQGIITDPTTVLITGMEAGITRLILTDRDMKSETVDVVVQTDVEYLRSLIKRSVPTANVEPIPGSNNTIILNGTVSRLDDVETILGAARAVGGAQITNHMRVGGVQQVELCVTVASVSRSQFRALDFNFLTNSRNTFFGSTIGQAVVNPASIGSSGAFSVAPAIVGTPGTPNGVPTNLFFGVLHNGWGLLTFLQALKEENVVKTLAEPKLIALSGRPASFLSGGEQAVPIPAGLGQVGVQFEEFGTRLNFLPIVLGGGKLRLEVEPEVSALNQAFGTSIQGTIVPGRTTQRVHTTVELEDGQTFVIGGLIQRDVTATVSKVPVLGELPFVGAAFSSKSMTETEQELIVLVTPHLIDAMSCDQVIKTLPGQETRSPDDFELFLEGILEAPRGQRDISFPHGYVPAYKNGPSASRFPCGSDLGGNGHGCGNGGCAQGVGPNAAPVTLPVPGADPVGATSQPLPPAPSTGIEDTQRNAPAEAIPTSPAPATGRPTILPPGLSGPESDSGPPQ